MGTSVEPVMQFKEKKKINNRMGIFCIFQPRVSNVSGKT